jgi:phytanoyl-CoA hydroxylase
MDSAAIRESYSRDGYVLIKGALSNEELAPSIQSIEAWVETHAQKLLAEGKIKHLHSGEPFERRLAALYDGREMVARMMDEPMTPAILNTLVRRDGIVDVLEAILGPRVSFTGDYHLRPKLPDNEHMSFPMHQDSQYYGKETRAAHIVTVWVPLVDVDESNGCLWLMPGSQRWGFFDAARDKNQNMRTFEDIEKRGEIVLVPMRAGDVLFFTNLTFHGSKLNTSKNVRWSLDLRYCPTPGEEMPRAEREGLEFLRTKLDSYGRKMQGVRGEGVGV